MAFQARKKSQTACVVATRAKAPNSLAQCLSGFENPLPRTKVRGYTTDWHDLASRTFRLRSWLRLKGFHAPADLRRSVGRLHYSLRTNAALAAES